MSRAVIGALLGLCIAGGVWLVLTRWIATKRPGMAARIAPFLGSAAVTPPPPSRGPMGTLVALAQPSLAAMTGSSGSSIAQRLSRAGRLPDVDRFRMEQIAVAGIGLLLGMVLGALAVIRGAPPLGVLVLGAVGAVIGVLFHDRRLTANAKRRQRRISQQLPTAAELLAFAVAAGESPSVALHRVATSVVGDLSDEISEAVVDMRAGAPLDVALRSVADRCGSADVERFIDGLLVSIERGTPLVEVLRAQAGDARAAERRRLMEIAGRKDVAMLLPVVFLILPTIIVIALFPGYRNLQGLIT
jgi:tight adherence protein C